MRAVTTILRAAIVASMVAGASMTVIAQDDEAPLPARVTGTIMELTSYTDPEATRQADSAASADAAGVARETGHLLGQRVKWSDPRLPSEHWIRLNLAIYDADSAVGLMTVESSHLLLDDAGAWRGTGRAFIAPDERDSYYELVGEGAYDGLHAFLRGTTGADAHGPWDVEYEGWIFEGDTPGYPEPAEVASGEGMLMRMQPDPERVTDALDAAPADPMAAAPFVFRSEQESEPYWGVDHENADGSVSESRGLVLRDRIEATDPRASGLMTTWQNRTQVETDEGVLLNWSITTRLVNEGGAWAGPSQLVGAYSDEVMRIAGLTKLTGQDGYDGLTLFMHMAGDHFSVESWGLIVPDELLAPMPDPVGPAGE